MMSRRECRTPWPPRRRHDDDARASHSRSTSSHVAHTPPRPRCLCAGCCCLFGRRRGHLGRLARRDGECTRWRARASPCAPRAGAWPVDRFIQDGRNGMRGGRRRQTNSVCTLHTRTMARANTISRVALVAGGWWGERAGRRSERHVAAATTDAPALPPPPAAPSPSPRTAAAAVWSRGPAGAARALAPPPWRKIKANPPGRSTTTSDRSRVKRSCTFTDE